MKCKNPNICPTCHQNMRALPHKGVNNKDCPQCGQGINWKAALKKAKPKKINRHNINFYAAMMFLLKTEPFSPLKSFCCALNRQVVVLFAA